MSTAEGGNGLSETEMLVESLSDSSREVLDLAYESAQKRNHSYLGGEHLLYGLCYSKRFSHVMQDLNLSPQQIVSALDFIAGRGDNPFIGPLMMTNSAVISLRHTHTASEQFKRAEVEPIDIMYGLVKEGEGLAAGIVESLGVDLHKIEGHMIKPGQL